VHDIVINLAAMFSMSDFLWEKAVQLQHNVKSEHICAESNIALTSPKRYAILPE
jgi:hypothetical protein